MYKAAQMSLWQGRLDEVEGELGCRWYQKVQPYQPEQPEGVAILGFASDEGVKRNLGRVGAKAGPAAIRKVLANQAWHMAKPVYDAGDVSCDDEALLTAQQELAEQIDRVMQDGHFPLVLGGGHEIGFASWQGINRFAQRQAQSPRVGIVNLDAHFDLRDYSEKGSSGTPFKQVAEQCDEQGTEFLYCCLGVAEGANTPALFQRADRLNVSYRLDEDMGVAQLSQTQQQLAEFIERCDWIYLTIDIDVLPAAVAPGVSAPAARGVELEVVEALVKQIKASGKLRLADLAELNPELDIDQHTARTAARLAYLIARA